MDIIEQLARDRVIEEIIENITNSPLDDDLKDLAQDLYLDLLLKDKDKITSLYTSGGLRWFLVRMVTNNLLSKNSRYYYTYIKDRNKMIDIDIYNEGEGED